LDFYQNFLLELEKRFSFLDSEERGAIPEERIVHRRMKTNEPQV
jgi:hypothetical protein